MSSDEFFDDWKWQISNRISTREQLEEYIDLTDEERAAFDDGAVLPFSITPHFAKQLNHSALRKTVVPTLRERRMGAGERADPLGEEDHRATPHLIHTYPDKVLFLATTFCSTICRYCTRSRLIVDAALSPESSAVVFEPSYKYIEQHTEIRDVLISGGDPLTLTDSVLDRILSRLRNIPHVRTIRIGSKVPVVLPMRITNALCSILRKYRVWLSLHFIHAAELSHETVATCRKLSDHGVAMVSQTVLLKGVNDDTEALINLFYGLLEINVKPYYLLQCDPVQGSEHFRTPVERGIELIQSLHGRISGLAVPQYVIDAPGGGGKVPLLGREQLRREGDVIILSNHDEQDYSYPDPRR